MAGALELVLFHRLVRDLGEDPEGMRWVMALWLWLESAGHHDFICRVAALPDPIVLRFVEEAFACLGCLSYRDYLGCVAAVGGRLPCTNASLGELINDVGYFNGHREEVIDGVTPLYKNVCWVVYGGCAFHGGARWLAHGGRVRRPLSLYRPRFPDDAISAERDLKGGEEDRRETRV